MKFFVFYHFESTRDKVKKVSLIIYQLNYIPIFNELEFDYKCDTFWFHLTYDL